MTIKQRLEILEDSVGIDNTTYYHGSTSKDLTSTKYGIHIGTKEAATQALEARIGVPAKGSWDGTRIYSETLLAGKRRLQEIERKENRYVITGFNCGKDIPLEDYFPEERKEVPTFSNGTSINLNCKPIVFKVKIIGKMANTRGSLISDVKANQLIKRSKHVGYYYLNEGEDVGSVSACVPNKTFLKVV